MPDYSATMDGKSYTLHSDSSLSDEEIGQSLGALSKPTRPATGNTAQTVSPPPTPQQQSPTPGATGAQMKALQPLFNAPQQALAQQQNAPATNPQGTAFEQHLNAVFASSAYKATDRIGRGRMVSDFLAQSGTFKGLSQAAQRHVADQAFQMVDHTLAQDKGNAIRQQLSRENPNLKIVPGANGQKRLAPNAQIMSLPAAAKQEIARREAGETATLANSNPFSYGAHLFDTGAASLLTVPGVPGNSALQNELARRNAPPAGSFLQSVAPGLMQQAQEAGGVPRGLANIANAVVSPTNAVLMATLPELQGTKLLNTARKAIDAYFTASMAKGTYDAARDTALMKQDPRAYLTTVLGQGALALLAAKGTVSGAGDLIKALGKGKEAAPAEPVTPERVPAAMNTTEKAAAPEVPPTTPEPAQHTVVAIGDGKYQLRGPNGDVLTTAANQGVLQRRADILNAGATYVTPGVKPAAPQPVTQPTAPEVAPAVPTMTQESAKPEAAKPTESPKFDLVSVDRHAYSYGGPHDTQVIKSGMGYADASEAARQANEQNRLGKDDGRLYVSQEAQESAGPAPNGDEPVAAAAGETVKPEPVAEAPVTTKAANAHAADERAALNLDALPPSERKTVTAAFAQAKQEHRAADADAVAEQVLARPRNLSDVETAGIVQRMQELKESILADRQKIEQDAAAGNTDAAQQTRALHDAKLAQYDRLDQARKVAGREWARTGLARQVEINTYDYVGTRQRMVAAQPDKPLTPQEDARVTALTSRLADTEQKLTAQQERVKELEAQTAARKMGLESRKQQRSMTRADLDTELDGMLKEFGQKAGGKASAGIDPTLYPLVGKIALNRLKAGAVTIEGLVDETYNLLKDHVEDITRRDVRDAISGYGKPTNPQDKNSLAAQMRDLQKQMRLVSAIEDAKAKEMPAKGSKPGQPSDAVVKLRKQLDDLMLAQGMKSPRDMSDQARLRMLKTRTQAQIDDLQHRIATGDISPAAKRSAVPVDAEAQSLQKQRDLLKHQIDQMIAAREKPHPLDYLARWQRLSLLSGVSTLGKLAAAATGRIAETPIEEAFGLVPSKIAPGIAAKATREGGFNPKAEAAALTGAFSKATLSDMWQKLRTGANSLDAKYTESGKASPHHPFFDFFGSLHGALKTPAQRGEFFRSFEKRAEAAARAGKDLKDPGVQMEVGMAAYADSKRAILMGDNSTVILYRQLMGNMERMGPTGKTAARLGKIVTPIVTVPTNYASEAANYVAGGPIGLYKLLAHGGTKNLTPAQADAVMRAFKKQGIGAGLLALGYFQPSGIQAGGYYAPGQKEPTDKSKPDFGEMVIFGVKIPHVLSHTPALEALQFGATVRRAMDAAHGNTTEGVGQAAFQGGMGMAQQVPFLDQAFRLGKAAESAGSMGKAAGELTKAAVVPMAAQQGAQFFDKDVAGNPVKRFPRGFTESVKTGVPGLRQQVPNTKQSGGRRSASPSLVPRHSRSQRSSLVPKL